MSSWDVIVVGAGNAAFCAALSAAEAGRKVLVLERAPEEESGGNSRFTAGLMRVAYRGVEDLKKAIPDLSPRKSRAPISAPTPRSSSSTTWAASPSTAAIRT